MLLAAASAALARRPPDLAASRQYAAQQLRQLDGCASADCAAGLALLSRLRARSAHLSLGPHAFHKAMRLCEAEAEAVESLHAELSSLGLADATAARSLARARLAAGRLREAAAALAPLLAARRVAAPTARLAAAVAAACAAAGLEDEAAALCSHRTLPPLEAGEEASRRATLRLEEAPPRLERTLAVLKPDAVKAGLEAEITSWIAQQTFEIVDIRRISLSEEQARQWLQVSWGSSAGDTERRFFQEMARFYASGEIVALLLQREGAIRAWRELLGPGDPSVARKHSPATVRAMWGTNKQANAAHGADSETAAQREIEFMFGAGCAVADPKLSHDYTLSDDPSPTTTVERSERWELRPEL